MMAKESQRTMIKTSLPLRRVDKARHKNVYSSHHLVSQSATLKERSVQSNLEIFRKEIQNASTTPFTSN